MVIAAPLYASQIAHTTPSQNHLTDQTVIHGEPTNVVSLEGIPIGPTWHGSFLLGADENGRDLAVRLLRCQPARAVTGRSDRGRA